MGDHDQGGEGVTAATSTTVGDHRRQLAEVLLDRSGLQLAGGVDHDQVVAVLAKALEGHPSPATEHGRLVLNALLPRPSMPRSPAETAVRRIVAGGRAPTPRAVAGELRQAEEAAQAWEARKARLRRRVDQEGPAAAAAVEDLWRSRGKAPSPRLLALGRGWPPRDTWAFIAVLCEAGWLRNQGRRLVPGPKARGPAPLEARRSCAPPGSRTGRGLPGASSRVDAAPLGGGLGPGVGADDAELESPEGGAGDLDPVRVAVVVVEHGVAADRNDLAGRGVDHLELADAPQVGVAGQADHDG